MNKLIYEYNHTYIRIIGIIDQYINTWQDNPVFSSSVSVFKAKYSEFKVMSSEYDQLNTQKAFVKKEIRDQLIELVYFVSVRVTSYANINDDEILSKAAGFTITSLKTATDNDLLAHAGVVLQTATENIAHLGPFQINQGVLDNLEGKIEEFAGAKMQFEDSLNMAKKYRNAMYRLQKETNDVLKKRLDLNILMFTEEDPLFVGLYWKARKKENLPTTRMAVMGKTVDAATGEPLPDVHVLVVETKLKRKSSRMGQFRIKNLPNKMYRLQFSKEGYKTLVLKIAVMTQATAKPLAEMELA